jgi:hypothetical protein
MVPMDIVNGVEPMVVIVRMKYLKKIFKDVKDNLDDI